MEHYGQGGGGGGSVVSCGAVACRFAFDSVLMIGEEETDKGVHGAFFGGRGCGWNFMVSNE